MVPGLQGGSKNKAYRQDLLKTQRSNGVHTYGPESGYRLMLGVFLYVLRHSWAPWGCCDLQATLATQGPEAILHKSTKRCKECSGRNGQASNNLLHAMAAICPSGMRAIAVAGGDINVQVPCVGSSTLPSKATHLVRSRFWHQLLDVEKSLQIEHLVALFQNLPTQ